MMHFPLQDLQCREEVVRRQFLQQKQKEESLQRREEELKSREIELLEREMRIILHSSEETSTHGKGI